MQLNTFHIKLCTKLSLNSISILLKRSTEKSAWFPSC